MSTLQRFSPVYHNTPPVLDAASRKRAFYIDEPFKKIVLAKIRGKKNKALACLMYSYFRLTTQFFNSAHIKDLLYFSKQFGINEILNWGNYNKDAKREHKKLILDFMGVHAFDSTNLPIKVEAIISTHANVRKDIKKCFNMVAHELNYQRMEIPDFETLDKLITKYYLEAETKLLNIVDEHLTANARSLIDKLYTKSKYDVQSESYRITLLKKFSHKLKVGYIKQNIESFDILHEIFETIQPVLFHLNLSVETIKHYATAVNKSQIFQLARKQDVERYLMSICFITHQYFTLQDTFVEILLSSVRTAYNVAERDAKSKLYDTRNLQSSNIENMLNDSDEMIKKFHEISNILKNEALSSDEKVINAQAELVKFLKEQETVSDHLESVREDQRKLTGEALFFQYLEAGAKALENKCSGIIQRLSLSSTSINEPLFNAIQIFKQLNAKVEDISPVDFLTSKEKKYVNSPSRNKSLYKVILFHHTAQAIKGDGLHLKYSYKYLMLDDYFISKPYFNNHLDTILADSNLSDSADFDEVYKQKDAALHAQFQETNEHILADQNAYIKKDGVGGIRTTNYRKNNSVQLSDEVAEIELFPTNDTVPLIEVISVVANGTNFLDRFQHFSGNNRVKPPSRKTLIAAITSAALHFSTHKFSQLCESINDSSLVTAFNNYLSVTNASLASDDVIKYVDGMPLSSIYLDNGKLYTSSDGQKYSVSVDSLNARPSFKYGGNHHVVAPYNFIDSRHLSYHSQVLSATEREAHYVIDGLLKNDVIKTDMHVTDTHGYTEVVCGVAELLGFNFAPRIKNVLNLQLYSTRAKRSYSSKHYSVLPSGKINMELIKPYWSEILRLVASIKLGKSTASQIFKRLNSYSACNHPLYNALREYGRMVKTLHVLRYIDDPELRVATTKQLNKGESANALDRALAIGKAEIMYATREEQEVMETCKRLIKNCIVCWNYMYLTQRLLKIKSKEKRLAFVEKMKVSSTMSWEHIIIHGAFDYSERKLKDSKNFDFNKMQDPKIYEDLNNS